MERDGHRRSEREDGSTLVFVATVGGDDANLQSTRARDGSVNGVDVANASTDEDETTNVKRFDEKGEVHETERTDPADDHARAASERRRRVRVDSRRRGASKTRHRRAHVVHGDLSLGERALVVDDSSQRAFESLRRRALVVPRHVQSREINVGMFAT